MKSLAFFKAKCYSVLDGRKTVEKKEKRKPRWISAN